ncbi:unnamed protein product [Strongylus vulgaris]|uniref:PIN domain-containing protein n=1 Tax=Strongylus vulgaris TaxID=40348 RepID=A0A3P7JNK6_STRVU|nr:unnamed protein product [Strongylus vulgaris]
MDCTEWEEPAGSPKDAEAMDIDFTEDLRQVRVCEYDQETLPSTSQSYQPFAGFSGASRSCVVFDTCALIDDSDLIHDCISKLVFVVIPYRVFYELDRMKKLTSNSESAVELRRETRAIVDRAPTPVLPEKREDNSFLNENRSSNSITKADADPNRKLVNE